MSQKNLQSTFRLMTLSSSGLKDERKAIRSASVSLCKLSGAETGFACAEMLLPSSSSKPIFSDLSRKNA